MPLARLPRPSFARRAVSAGLLLAAIVALGGCSVGCSRAALKSTPLWDAEYERAQGPPESRVNVWPLFYYRDPAWSALWPLISRTDEGHAFVPFYEKIHEGDDLRLGTIHPDLFSLAHIEGNRGRWRVLNFAYDGKDNDLVFFPLYYQDFDDGELFILPVYWGDKDGFWSPLLTLTKTVTGILGPLFFKYEKGNYTSYHLPFPLVQWWSSPALGGSRVFPLYYYTNTPPRETLNLGVVLYHHSEEPGRSATVYLWPFGWVGHSKDRTWNSLFPLWLSWTKKVGGEVEGDPGREESTFLSLPYIAHSDGEAGYVSTLLNVYVSVWDATSSYLGVVWPIFQRWRDERSDTRMLLPLYYHRTSADGSNLLVTPLAGAEWGGENSLLTLLGPVYIDREKPNTHYKAVAWPLFVYDRTGDTWRHTLLPFYTYHHTPEANTFISLPYSYRDDGAFTNVAGVLYHKSKIGDRESTWAPWPLVHGWKSPDSEGSWVLPLFVRRIADGWSSWFTPLVSHGTREDGGWFVNLLGVLFNRYRNSERTSTWFLWPLVNFRHSNTKDTSRSHIAPLYMRIVTEVRIQTLTLLSYFDSPRRTLEEARQAILNEVEGWLEVDEKGHRLKSAREGGSWSTRPRRHRGIFFLLGLAGLVEDIQPRLLEDDAAPAPGEVLGEVTIEGDAPIRYGFATATTRWLFPFFYSYEKEGQLSVRNILWRLYDSRRQVEEDGTIYTRQRVLWRVFHRETLGDRTAIDVFPFIAYDASPESTKLSWVAGLLEYGHDAAAQGEDKSHLKLLWIPFRW